MDINCLWNLAWRHTYNCESVIPVYKLNLSNLLFEYRTVLGLSMWSWGEKNQTQITFWEIQRENPDNSSQCRAGVLMSIFTELIVFIQVLLAHGSSPSTRLMPAPTTCPKPTPGEETVSTLACFRLFDMMPEFEMSERVVLNHDEVLAFIFLLNSLHFDFTVKVVKQWVL